MEVEVACQTLDSTLPLWTLNILPASQYRNRVTVIVYNSRHLQTIQQPWWNLYSRLSRWFNPSQVNNKSIFYKYNYLSRGVEEVQSRDSTDTNSYPFAAAPSVNLKALTKRNFPHFLVQSGTFRPRLNLHRAGERGLSVGKVSPNFFSNPPTFVARALFPSFFNAEEGRSYEWNENEKERNGSWAREKEIVKVAATWIYSI